MGFGACLKGEEYGFLRENEHLGKHVILLGVAGSYTLDIANYYIV